MIFRRPELEKDNPIAPEPYIGPRRRLALDAERQRPRIRACVGPGDEVRDRAVARRPLEVEHDRRRVEGTVSPRARSPGVRRACVAGRSASTVGPGVISGRCHLTRRT